MKCKQLEERLNFFKRDSVYGPTFGLGYDLLIYDKSNLHSDSCA
mgnify:CR=1 FL=1